MVVVDNQSIKVSCGDHGYSKGTIFILVVLETSYCRHSSFRELVGAFLQKETINLYKIS